MTSRHVRFRVLLPAIVLALTAGPAAADLRIGLQEFDRLRHDGRVLVVDVRDEAAYRKAHVPGAVSIPIDQLDAQAEHLRASGDRVVTYCGGPAGEAGARAAARLRHLGLGDVWVLDGGLQRWVDAGRVVVVDPNDG